MATTTILQLPLAIAAGAADQIELVQSSTSMRTSVATLATAVGVQLGLISNTTITLEKLGGKAATGFNAQPYLQQAVNLCVAGTYNTLSLGAGTYELWCPIRTTDPVYGYQVTDGIYCYVTRGFRITGVPGQTFLRFLNSQGGTNDVVTQSFSGVPWRGYGIVYNPPGVDNGMTIENVFMDGTKTYYFPGAPTNATSDITHKAIAANPVTGDFNKLLLREVISYNWGGEIYYLGGNTAGGAGTIEAYECEGYNSNQSAWNPTGLGRVTGYNLQMHDSYLASEIISGQGHTYYAGKFSNAYNAGAVGTQFYVGGYGYSYPNRNNSVAPPFVKYLDTTIQNIASFNFASWSWAKIKMVDSGATCGATGRDIYIDVDNLIDQGTSTVLLTLSGPATLTTQIPNCPTGVYYTPLTTTTIKIRTRRTQRAVANFVTNIVAVQIQPGLIDSTSVRIFLEEAEVIDTQQMIGTPVAGQIQPLIIVGDVIALGNPYGGDTYAISGAANFTPNFLAMSFQPTGVGPFDIGMANSYSGAPYVPADGQIYTFYHNGPNGNQVRMKANAPLCALQQDRVLANKGDILQIKWNLAAGVFEEYYFSSSRQTTFTGSASITPTSLASGAQETVGTITVTGAAVGDLVVAVSANVSAAGVRLWGDVTASNTVTVYANNLSGSTWNPGALTFTTMVRKI